MAGLAPKLLTEFLGTFFLCLTVYSAAGIQESGIAAIAIGCALMVGVYAGGHVSGAHYNPAVTVSLLVRKAAGLSVVDGLLYIVVQLAGSAVAFFTAVWMAGGKRATGCVPGISSYTTTVQASVIEFFGTFALCSVVLHVATSKAQNNNSYYGLAIGGTVLSHAISIGGLSGGALNPAVGFMAVFQQDVAENALTSFGVYAVACILGGMVAAVVFRLVSPGDHGDEAHAYSETVSPLIIEFIGTFYLCYTVATTCRSIENSGVLIPLSIGSILMCMIYMGAAVSGAQYNPAVSIGVLVRNLIDPTHDDFGPKKAIQYILTQLVASAAAVWVAAYVVGADGDSVVSGRMPGYPSMNGKSYPNAIVAEILGTFLLVYVVLNVATVSALHGNQFFGIAIGMVITTAAAGLGPISSGAFNPAVGSMGLFYKGDTSFWVYYVGPIVGAVLAVFLFKVQNPDEFDPEHSGNQYSVHAEANENDRQHHKHVKSHDKSGKKKQGDEENLTSESE